ncbi:MAG: transglycosylase SLT domain-containing protein [Pelagimonas sp.]|nr:transglycosylase SLT domain-containing protein [Pelagimonas sp.]
MLALIWGAPQPVQAADSALAVTNSPRPQARAPLVIPNARWQGQEGWTLALLRGLRSHGAVLPRTVPRDIASWCPAYASADTPGREAFWVGLISSLAWHESTHRPTAVGGGGRWYGLVQIYPDTARRYGCKARSGAALKDPALNLSCALRIMAVTVPRDGVVSQNMRGVAADWGPFHSRRKREDMRSWTRAQDYCTGLASSPRPRARPDPKEDTQPAPSSL